MSTTSTVCTCDTCPGSTCTCGCQSAASPTITQPAAACQCGEVCTCGPDCRCQPREDASTVTAEMR